jgi:hypothetical protein
MFAIRAIANKPAITYIVVLYSVGEGLVIPLGTIVMRLEIVTVFCSTSCESWLISAPGLYLHHRCVEKQQDLPWPQVFQ